MTQSFPKQEQYGLASQMQQAAVSVPSNIAEGHDREHINEYLHHLAMAQGSLAELETQLEITLRLGYIDSATDARLAELAAGVGRQLHTLRNALRKKRDAGDTTQPKRCT